MRGLNLKGLSTMRWSVRPKRVAPLAILLLALGLCGCETIARHYITNNLPDLPIDLPGDKHCEDGHGNDCPTDTTKGGGE